MSNKFDIFITVIITIITLIIGWLLNLFSTKITFKKTRELEKRKLLQTKIEEIAKLIDEIDQGFRQIWVELMKNVSIGTEINLKNIDMQFTRVQILIDFYFPELRTEYNELMKEKNKFGIQWVYLLAEKNKTNQEGLIATITEIHERIKKICEKIISLSSKIAQKIL